MSRLSIISDVKKHPLIPWLICGIGALFYGYEYILRIAPSIMSSELMHDFRLSASRYGSVIALYYFAYSPMQLVVGVLIDRYGPRRLLVAACALCVIGAFIFGSAQSVWMLGFGRLLIGLGSAFAFVGALKIATIWLPPNRFAFASGLITTLGTLAAMGGDIFIAPLVEWHGWRMTTFDLAILGVFLIVIMFVFVQDRIKTSHHTFYVADPEFKDVLKGLWFAIKSPYIWMAGAIGCLMYLGLSTFAELWGISYLIQAHHISYNQSATAISLMFLGWSIGGPIIGFLSDKFQQRRMPLMVGSMIGLFIMLIVLYVPNLSLFSVESALFSLGFVISAQIIVFAISREVSPEKISGTAIAFTNMLIMLGGLVFQPVIGWLLDLHWHGTILQGVPIYSIHDYQIALSILPIGLIISFILGFFLRETRASRM